MNKNIIAILMILLSIGCSPSVVNDDDDRLAMLEAEVVDLKNEIASLKTENAVLKASIEEKDKEIDNLSNNILQLKFEIEDCKSTDEDIPEYPDDKDAEHYIIINNAGLSQECEDHSDCIIIDTEEILNFSCCSSCRTYEIDYSKDNFIAINVDAYTWAAMEKKDFMTEECQMVDCPACTGPIKTVNEDYIPRCVKNKCEKISIDDIEKPDDCTCPLYSPPEPGWCRDGYRVPPVKDECGCTGPSRCVEFNLMSCIFYNNIHACPENYTCYFTSSMSENQGLVRSCHKYCTDDGDCPDKTPECEQGNPFFLLIGSGGNPESN